ncbi:MAG: hypothetical protein ACJA1L_000423 [Paracoccaceae bacterium]|jgi:uncharacterized protein (DUF427 family)
MTNAMTISPIPGVLVVRAGGAVVAETAHGLAVLNQDVASRWLPLAQANVFLDATETVNHIPGIGSARGYDLIAKSGPIALAAWAVEVPDPGAEALMTHVTFDETRVAVEQL